MMDSFLFIVAYQLASKKFENRQVLPISHDEQLNFEKKKIEKNFTLEQ